MVSENAVDTFNSHEWCVDKKGSSRKHRRKGLQPVESNSFIIHFELCKVNYVKATKIQKAPECLV